MNPQRRRVAELFSDYFGSPPEKVADLAADGSSRTYFRLSGSGGQTAIGTVGPDPSENRAFLSYSEALRSAGLNVPAVYAADEGVGVWLAEDLGDTTLFRALEAARRRTGERFPSEIESLFREALSALPGFQIKGGEVVDFSMAYPRADFDGQSILWDLNYFKYHFLKLAQIPFDEARLEEDFGKLIEFAIEANGRDLLHRDFQSRNIMIHEEEPWFIDYQGARRGAQQYDVASLLCSATTDVPVDAQSRLLNVYLDALEAERPVDRESWRKFYRGFVLIRLMQAMGAYGYRGFFEGRPRFLRSIPKAAEKLEHLLAEGLPIVMPELETTFRRIAERWGGGSSEEDPETKLTIRLSSFSYRHGYPNVPDEHGGGFIFDCRALPNPGREEKYRTLSGLDRAVVEHLERHDPVQSFWENTQNLVEAQVENYLSRDFRSLTIAYGCTGGQHRSVYFVERMAKHLKHRFPEVEVRVTHRERGRWPEDDGVLAWTP